MRLNSATKPMPAAMIEELFARRTRNPLWNPVALREAVINAIIHSDYSTELVPKFEIYNDRLEITSAGAVHPGREREDFFAGYSMPRILKAYLQKAFTYSSRFDWGVAKYDEPKRADGRSQSQRAREL